MVDFSPLPVLERSLVERLALAPAHVAEDLFRGWSGAEVSAFLASWEANARPKQVLPPGAWYIWLALAGRGWGKTRVGAEAVCEWERDGVRRIHLIAPTAADARDVMVEGPSGILACAPPGRRPIYEPSKRRLTWPSGCVAIHFTAEEPQRLRGPQAEKVWADELAAWQYLQQAWEMMEFGLRLGSLPQVVVTTTPKPYPLLIDLIKEGISCVDVRAEGGRLSPRVVLTKGSSYENVGNLAPQFYRNVIRPKEGTRLGRQEIFAELLLDTVGALWKMALLEETRRLSAPQMERIVVGVDPAGSSSAGAAETGIVVCGIAAGHGYVLADYSIHGTPVEWAHRVVAAVKEWRADLVVGEVNYGGELVEANLRAIAPHLPYRSVRATRGKVKRAEPVSLLYERRIVHHIGNFAELESQMTTWRPSEDPDAMRSQSSTDADDDTAKGTKRRGASPDRMDAAVWGLTELFGLSSDAEAQAFVGVG